MNKDSASVNAYVFNFVLALLFVLMFIWQMPGTIALRNSTLAVLMLCTVFLFASVRRVNVGFVFKQPAMIGLFALTGWLTISLLWAVEPRLSIGELKGQWLISVACAVTGGLLASVAALVSKDGVRKGAQAVFLGLLGLVVLHDLFYLAYWSETGDIPFRSAPVLDFANIISVVKEGKPFAEGVSGNNGDKFSYVSNMLAAFVVAELLQRVLFKKSWITISWPLLLLSGVAVLVCTYLLNFRNGNIGLLLLIAFAGFMVLVRLAKQWPLKKTGIVVSVFAISFVGFAGALYKADARWQSFAETVSIALDTKTHQAWRLKGEPYPLLQSGQRVDKSNYERVAWITEGIKLVADNPMGTGYNRNAFGDGIDRKYQMNGVYRGGHAHSGLIDFAIANGVPGLILWLAFLGALFYTGWVAFMGGQIAPAMALMFIVSGFFSRSMVDSNIRDHMLQQFMFLSLFFAVALKTTRTASGRADD